MDRLAPRAGFPCRGLARGNQEMSKRSQIEATPVASRVISGAKSVRQRIAKAMDRGQLGPSRERDLRSFGPGR